MIEGFSSLPYAERLLRLGIFYGRFKREEIDVI